LARFVFPNLTGDNGNGPSPAIGGHQPRLRHDAKFCSLYHISLLPFGMEYKTWRHGVIERHTGPFHAGCVVTPH